MLGHKTSLNKFNIKIISSISSDHNGMKLDINHKKKTEKHTTTWRLNNTMNRLTMRSRKISKDETNENEKTTSQNLWDTVKST